MTIYAVLRVAHSYWRWAVLLTSVVLLFRTIMSMRTAAPWTGGDQRAIRQFLGALDFQFLLGLVLYFGFSPFWQATLHSFKETMASPVARFFGIEHQTTMLLAIIAAHAGLGRVKLAVSDARKRRTILITMLIFFALALWAVPWPWRIVGRPLFRTTW